MANEEVLPNIMPIEEVIERVTDFATGSPRETLKTAFSLGIINDEKWLEMLRVRNTLAHDYDGQVAVRYYNDIVGDYYILIETLVRDVEKYYVDCDKS